MVVIHLTSVQMICYSGQKVALPQPRVGATARRQPSTLHPVKVQGICMTGLPFSTLPVGIKYSKRIHAAQQGEVCLANEESNSDLTRELEAAVKAVRLASHLCQVRWHAVCRVCTYTCVGAFELVVQEWLVIV